MDLIVPNWREINTTWIKGNTCNVEEILALEPDLVIVYGKEQAEGLDVLPMPVLNFLESSKDNEQTTINRDKFMREIFGVDSDTSLEEEWKTANEKVAQCLSAVEGQPQPKALMIFNNTGEKITVRGSNTYGDSWITKSGMINVAAEVEGDGVEVTMEQIYQWNPDIIIVHGGLPETDYLTNSISGQDWSQVEAFKNGRIYYTPKGISAWTAPNADSPMMAQWMVMRAYPDTYPEEEFVSNLISYYQRRYGVEITEDLAEEIIWPHGPAE
ncbi:MAG TPA: ABC transporter substrate-binding protein [Clostridiaceae bacterium]|nr:ABC transporter substrate-binding protein [Clostridiaceae bacterium]